VTAALRRLWWRVRYRRVFRVADLRGLVYTIGVTWTGRRRVL
jgi:hypothetical protein